MLKRKIKGSNVSGVIGIIFLATILLVTVGACSSGSSTESPAETPISTTPPKTTAPTPTKAPTETAAPTATPAPTPEPTPAPLFLEVLSPEDESIVNTSEIEVTGNTLSSAIVSVNEEMITVNPDGSFSTTITLEEGTNDIEVVASDIDGQELYEPLFVTYMP